MMLDIFENREKTVWSLFKLADCLGRSLRENVALFYIDSSKEKVSFITESDKVITGTYNLEGDVSINDIAISDSDAFKSGEEFDGLVSDKIHNFVGSLAINKINEASDDFDDILKLWQYRIKFDHVKNKLDEQSQKFDETQSILKTEEIQRLAEITPQLISYLNENQENFEAVSEIANAVKLSSVVAEAFDFPAITKEQLEEQSRYAIKPETTDSVFNMICKQELIKKELLESKKSFDVIWATNDKIKGLAGMLFESDEKVAETLAECLEEVPYMALVSKSTLAKTITNALSFNDGISISEKDIKSFASTLFEMKKPVRTELIKVLNEQYGVNLQNLKEIPSFRSLLNTQVVIFESLARLSPKNSLQKQVLSEVSTMLKYKNGVESIDINDYLARVFTSAGYLEEATAEAKKAKKPEPGIEKYIKPEAVDMDKVAKDIQNAGKMFDLIKKNMQYSSEEGLESEPKEEEKAAAAPAPAPEAPAEEQPEAAPTAPDETAATADTDDEMLSNLSELESIVNDLASELGLDSDQAAEPKEDK